MAEATEPKQSEGEAAEDIADMTGARQEMVEPKRSEGEILLASQQSVYHTIIIVEKIL